jgi:glycosyltransferase involved in cell wall biosynthesis
MKLSIVIPVFNEKKTIRQILKAVEKAPLFPRMRREIIIVDDGSSDGTRTILKNIQKPNVKIFYHHFNKGKGAALRTGFKKCTGDIIIVQDADLEYNPKEYKNLLAPIIQGKADVVYGSRFEGSGPHRILYFWHFFANRFLTLFSNMFSDLNLTDMETCYKVFKKDVLKKITIEENRFGFEPEITAKIAHLAREEKIAIYEVGISYYGRTYKEGKKLGAKDAFRAFLCILKYNDSLLARMIKYGLNGLLVAISQLITIVFLVKYLGLETKLWQNISYAISIEVSILVGFVLHAFLTWNYQFKKRKEIGQKLFSFHLVTGASFIIRQILFYLLSSIDVNYLINTFIGIAVAIVLNFLGYDKIVFLKNNQKEK